MSKKGVATAAVAVLMVLVAQDAWAQISPWERVAFNISDAFTGPIARLLAGVAVVVGGLSWAYGEDRGVGRLAGICFGIAMALSAPSFVAWLAS